MLIYLLAVAQFQRRQAVFKLAGIVQHEVADFHAGDGGCRFVARHWRRVPGGSSSNSSIRMPLPSMPRDPN